MIMDTHFQKDLEELKGRLLEMATLVDMRINPSKYIYVIPPGFIPTESTNKSPNPTNSNSLNEEQVDEPPKVTKRLIRSKK